MTKKTKHIKKRRQRPRPSKKKKTTTKQSANAFNPLETQMRVMEATA